MIALLLLSGCGTGLRIHPDAHCPVEIEGETWREKITVAVTTCAPMIRVTLPSHVERWPAYETP